MIYFLQDTKAFTIKIGYSATPQGRVRSLQTGNSSPLELLAEIPGTQEDEQRLHERFAKDRVMGEWFSPSPSLLRFVQSEEAKLPSKIHTLTAHLYQSLYSWQIASSGWDYKPWAVVANFTDRSGGGTVACICLTPSERQFPDLNWLLEASVAFGRPDIHWHDATLDLITPKADGLLVPFPSSEYYSYPNWESRLFDCRHRDTISPSLVVNCHDHDSIS